jgi:Segregation and condensation complex subunit ScpB
MVGEMVGGTVGDMGDDTLGDTVGGTVEVAVVDVAGEGDRDGSSLVEREIDLDNPDCPDIDNTGISVTGTDDPQLVEAHLEGAYVGTEDALADYSRADDTRAYLEQRRAIEAVLMVAESPVEPTMLAQLLELPPATVDQICDELARSYRNDQRASSSLVWRAATAFRATPTWHRISSVSCSRDSRRDFRLLRWKASQSWPTNSPFPVPKLRRLEGSTLTACCGLFAYEAT